MTTPARDYTMVDVGNGLTSKLLEIGTTSFTFSVEWPLDMKFETGMLDLFGKLNSDSGWSPLTDVVRVDPSKGNATFEIPYNWLIWHHFESERTKFEQKAFFHFGVVDPNDTGWLGPRPEEEEPQSKLETEQGGAVGVEKSNRLGFYAGIIFVIGAGFFFLRKRFARN